VRRFAGTVVAIALVLGAVACGGSQFFISTGDGGVIFFTASGMVGVAQLTIINGSQVTLVTLIDTGTTQTFDFCGDVVGQFPTDTFVKATYKHSGACDTLVQVVS